MPMNRLSPAGVQLFGNSGVPDMFGAGSALKQQVADDLEEERRRRQLGLSELSPTGGSAAFRSLMGGGMAGGSFGSYLGMGKK
jgi:hypothetical protein